MLPWCVVGVFWLTICLGPEPFHLRRSITKFFPSLYIEYSKWKQSITSSFQTYKQQYPCQALLWAWNCGTAAPAHVFFLSQSFAFIRIRPQCFLGWQLALVIKTILSSISGTSGEVTITVSQIWISAQKSMPLFCVDYNNPHENCSWRPHTNAEKLNGNHSSREHLLIDL